MTSQVTLGVTDFNGEKSSFGFHIPTLTSANFDASLTVVDGLIANVNGVTLEDVSRQIVKARDIPYGGASADPNAQRELKWRVVYSDPTDPIGNGSFEIPCPDLSLLVAGTGEMNTSAGAGATLVTGIEANMVSRLGNAIQVDRIYLVGRNI